MKLIHSLLVGLILAVEPSLVEATSTEPFEVDAYNLAVEHFNRNGDKKLDWNGPEKRFMLTVLNQIFKPRNIEPSVSSIPLGKLSCSIQEDNNPQYAKQKNWILSLSKDCRSSRSGSRLQISLTPDKSRKCSGKLAKALRDLGFSKVAVGMEMKWPFMFDLVSSPPAIDLRYLKPQFTKDLMLASLCPNPGEMRSRCSNCGTTLDNSSGHASFSNSFVIQHGFNEPGAIRDWNSFDKVLRFKVTPRQSGQDYAFDIVEEQGSKR